MEKLRELKEKFILNKPEENINLIIANIYMIESGEINAETIIDFIDSNNKYVDIYNKTKSNNPYEIKFPKKKTYISDILDCPNISEELKADLKKMPEVENMLIKEKEEFQEKWNLYEGNIEIVKQENEKGKLYPILDIEDDEKLYPVLE